MARTAKTDEQLKQLAIDYVDGKVFSSNQIPEEDQDRMLGSVFMLIKLGVFQDMPKEEMHDIGLIYEYLDKAGPRSVNGYPSFMTLQYLTKGEALKMGEFYDEYVKMKENFMQK